MLGKKVVKTSGRFILITQKCHYSRKKLNRNSSGANNELNQNFGQTQKNRSKPTNNMPDNSKENQKTTISTLSAFTILLLLRDKLLQNMRTVQNIWLTSKLYFPVRSLEIIINSKPIFFMSKRKQSKKNVITVSILR